MRSCPSSGLPSPSGRASPGTCRRPRCSPRHRRFRGRHALGRGQGAREVLVAHAVAGHRHAWGVHARGARSSLRPPALRARPAEATLVKKDLKGLARRRELLQYFAIPFVLGFVFLLQMTFNPAASGAAGAASGRLVRRPVADLVRRRLLRPHHLLDKLRAGAKVGLPPLLAPADVQAAASREDCSRRCCLRCVATIGIFPS